MPDIGRALAELGSRDGVTGEVWHVPNDPATRTTRELVAIAQEAVGRPGLGLRRTPPVLLRVLGLWNPTVRSLLEMQYQFEEPFVVDSTKITSRLGLLATPLADAIARTAGHPLAR